MPRAIRMPDSMQRGPCATMPMACSALARGLDHDLDLRALARREARAQSAPWRAMLAATPTTHKRPPRALACFCRPPSRLPLSPALARTLACPSWAWPLARRSPAGLGRLRRGEGGGTGSRPGRSPLGRGRAGVSADLGPQPVRALRAWPLHRGGVHPTPMQTAVAPTRLIPRPEAEAPEDPSMGERGAARRRSGGARAPHDCRSRPLRAAMGL